MIPFFDLAREERILTVIALGAATVVLMHFGIFEAARLWREFLSLLERFRKALDRAPSRPQWTEDPEPVRRQQLDAVIIPFDRRIP